MEKTTPAPARPSARVRLDAPERRRQLAEIAADLFYRGGFHDVPLSAVARSAGVTAPAVYRHFESKPALLVAAINTGLDLVEEAIAGTETSNWAGLVRRLAEVANQRRDLWILLQRERRHLPADGREKIDRRFRSLIDEILTRLAGHRPRLRPPEYQLITTAVLAVLTTPSGYKSEGLATNLVDDLVAAALVVSDCRLPRRRGDATRARPSLRSATRSEQLLETAVRLFHDRGYSAVSLDDIGAAVGMAGPSIYHHFDSKEQLLAEAFRRASTRLTPSDETGSPRDLSAIVDSYIDLAIDQPDLLGVYVTESRNLTPATAREMAQLVAANIGEWSAALHAAHPDLSSDAVAVRVHAARAIINDVVRLPTLRARTSLRIELQALCAAAMLAPSPQ